jgi:hypothetical protein
MLRKRKRTINYRRKKNQEQAVFILKMDAIHSDNIHVVTTSLPPKMPLLMRMGMYFSIFFAVGSSIVLLLMLLGIGTWPIAGSNYDAAGALRLAGPMFAITGLLMAFIAVGFYRRKSWARILVLLFWSWVLIYVGATAILGFISWKAALRPIIQSLLALPFSFWYFFRRPQIVAFFERISRP